MAGYAFIPEHKWGFVFSKEGQRLVFWLEDGMVEPDSEAPADERTVEEFRSLLGQAPKPVVRESDGRLRSALETHGFLLVAERQYRFMSGTLIQQADLLAEVATGFSGQRDQMLLLNDGLEPAAPDEWLEWYRITHTASSAAAAADMMTASAIEAFVNEVLANRYPELYEQLEVKTRSAPRAKLGRLCEELGIRLDNPWMVQMEVGFDRRRETVHFRPGYVDDEDLVAGPLDALTRPEAARVFVDAAFDAIAAILAATGSPVPPTHLPWRQAALSSATLLARKRHGD